MPKILLTHPAPELDRYYGARSLAALRALGDVTLNSSNQDWAGDDLVHAAQGMDYIVAFRQTAFPADVLAAMPSVKAVLRCAVDIHTIDVAAASKHGILITRCSAGFYASVAEWVLGVMIDLARGISRANSEYHEQGEAKILMGRELRAAKVGVIGYGGISRYLCPLLQALGMQVSVYDPLVNEYAAGLNVRNSLNDLVSDSEYLICLAPALSETQHLLNEALMRRLPKGAFVINPSRGQLLDDAALVRLLDGGHLAGGAADVGMAADQKPSELLARHPLVIATPHIGGLTPQAMDHQTQETVQQLADLLAGRVPHGAVNIGAL